MRRGLAWLLLPLLVWGAALAVVQSVGHTFYLAGSRTETFSVIVPERALHQGRP